MSGVGVHLGVWLYPEQSLKEPSIQNKPWYLQQGDEDEMDRVGLPQHCSNWNEGRGCLHLRNNQATIKKTLVINTVHFELRRLWGSGACVKKKKILSKFFLLWLMTHLLKFILAVPL